MAFIQLGGGSRVGEMILARERSGFAGEKVWDDHPKVVLGCWAGKKTFLGREQFGPLKSYNLIVISARLAVLALFERTESVFLRSNCTEDCKVKFATGTLTEEALSWWTSFAQPIGIEEAYKITWFEFKKLLIKKYYPRNEVKKMEDEFYNLTVKGNDIKTYVRRSRIGIYDPTRYQILRNSWKYSSGDYP
ncbi:reverse transcriptase domain-containing protein [Tanacetum coccineum]